MMALFSAAVLKNSVEKEVYSSRSHLKLFVFAVCAQVISTEKPGNHIFQLSGHGADRDPKGLFTIDIHTGDVSVSRSLDREAIDSYQVRTVVYVCVHLPVITVCLVICVSL